jgi:hypothetical protein
MCTTTLMYTASRALLLGLR